MSWFRVIFFLVAFSSLSFSVMPDLRDDNPFIFQTAYAQEDWRKEFDEICGKTQDAMAFNAEELKSLAERCDKLRPIIEKLAEPQRKVYLRRLQMCRDLFSFALTSKEKK